MNRAIESAEMDGGSIKCPGMQKRRVAAILAAGMLCLTNSASAQLMTFDMPAIMNAYMEMIQTIKQWQMEAQQWKKMEDDAKIGKSLTFNLSLPAGLDLREVEDDFMVVETCGEEARGLGMVKDMLNIGSGSGSPRAKQRQLCVNMQLVRNQKFNDTVQFLNRTMAEASAFARRVNYERDAAESSTGNVLLAANNADRFHAELTIKTQQWETRMKSYDAYLDAVQGYQNQLAKAAFKVDPGKAVLGAIVGDNILEKAVGL